MHRFNRWNNIAGWCAFVIAAVTYIKTIEPTVSFWDCGEFISCAFKLEVGHPPGAPLFLMIARFFSLFAPGPGKVALAINTMSALTSAFTVLFLFWTITRLTRRILIRDDVAMTSVRATAILASGMIGALAFAFSDTFWFSAVEAEVYGMSALFTAVVFWAILKWEEVADEPYANRWLVFIAYLMGLSIGVHLLNLLAIPAIVLVFYFRRFKPGIPGFLLALLVSVLLLAGVLYGLISGLIKLAGDFELFFVNSLRLPFGSGVIFYAFLIFSFLIFGLWITFKKRKVFLNTALLMISMVILGYGSYSMIVIRSVANTPINEDRPDNIFSLLSYLDREQYGESPLLYGPYYNAPILKVVDGKPTYTPKNGKYVVADREQHYTYDPRFMTVFPRMYSSNQNHAEIYKEWGRVKGKPMTVTRNGEQVIEYRPAFRENLLFFMKYQVGYMYVRYFMWNFSGRQNEVQGNGGILYGNWITGFTFLDSLFLGPQDKLPSYLKNNKGHNRYFLLPFLLGVIGFVYQIRKSKRYAFVVSLLFIMTGLAIAVFLNQTPLQPRERDYAYVGSFFAFSIWIGLGVLALIEWAKKWLPVLAPVIVSVVCLFAVPVLMASQNWDDHNRKDRYTARDVAYDYLNSCAPGAILFTNGDNDTFPLWYLQEVEGIRRDVRVVNLILLSSDWYIDELKQKVYDTGSVPISLRHDSYLSRRLNYVYFIPKKDDVMSLKEAVSFAASDDPKNKLIPEPGMVIDYIPSRNLMLPVDSAKVVSNGTVKPELANRVLAQIPVVMKQSYISKTELLVMDILSQNNWDKPVYFVSPHQEGTLGLEEYFQLDGFAYRLVPVYTKREGRFSNGRIESSILYDNLMNKFRWGNMNNPRVLIDDTNVGTFAVLRTRVNFARLAEQLFTEGRKDSALKVLDRCLMLMPSDIFPHDAYSLRFIESSYAIGAIKEARQVVNEYARKCFEEINFFYTLHGRLFKLTEYENIVAQQTIIQLADIAGKNGDTQVQEDLKDRLKKFTRK